jgi:hypothetical protein
MSNLAEANAIRYQERLRTALCVTPSIALLEVNEVARSNGVHLSVV